VAHQLLAVAALQYAPLQVVGGKGLGIAVAGVAAHGLGLLVLGHGFGPFGAQVQGAGQQVVGAGIGRHVQLGGFAQVGQGGRFGGRVQVAVPDFHVQRRVVGVEFLGGQQMRQRLGIARRVGPVLLIAGFQLTRGLAQAFFVVTKVVFGEGRALGGRGQRGGK